MIIKGFDQRFMWKISRQVPVDLRWSKHEASFV